MFGLDPTPFDLRLVAFRIPIRVHPSFWLFGAYMSWNPNHVDLVFIWVMCLFVSILVHELGHALAAEAFGWPAEIVLYWCGGLMFSQRHHHRTPLREIAVSLAGPFAGFGLFGLILLIEYLIPETVELPRNVRFIFGCMVQINLFWGLVNLLPVLPLDGGQVCQSLFAWFRHRDPARIAMQISLVFALAAAAYFFRDRTMNFAGMLFAFLFIQNLVSLQSHRSW